MKHRDISAILVATLAAGAALLASPPTAADASKHHDMDSSATSISTDAHAFGRQGNPYKVTRTIAVDMHDTMRFKPADITVKQGETVRFVITNKGKTLHEMVLGTLDELKEHGAMMKKFPGMEHEEPYMAHVRPGKKQQMVWQFTQAGEFYYACLIPGHFEAGMVGKINVTKG